jgi:hypothetical protein
LRRSLRSLRTRRCRRLSLRCFEVKGMYSSMSRSTLHLEG